MQHLMGMLDLVDREFAEMEQNGKFRNRDDVELVYKLMDIAKDAYCIREYEMKDFGGYSEYGRSYGNYQYPMNGYPYEGNYSNYNNNSNGRGRGYANTSAQDEYIKNLRDLMMDAPDDRTRDRIQRMIDNMR